MPRRMGGAAGSGAFMRPGGTGGREGGLLCAAGDGNGGCAAAGAPCPFGKSISRIISVKGWQRMSPGAGVL